jgi:hypothetical protein
VKRHLTDWTSLLTGITFCTIAISCLSADLSHRSLEVRWMLPMLLIGLGVAGLGGTVARGVRRNRPPIADDDVVAAHEVPR